MESTIVQGAWQYGVLGVVALVFGVAIIHLYKEGIRERRELLARLDAERAARIEDSRVTQLQFLDLVRQVTEALAHGTAANDAHRQALLELSEFLREFVDELKRSIYEDRAARERRDERDRDPPPRQPAGRRGQGG